MLCEDETIGPIFIKEPPNRVDFSNTTGAVVECAARGSPPPDVIWVRSDGTAVGDVPGLRQVAKLLLYLTVVVSVEHLVIKQFILLYFPYAVP